MRLPALPGPIGVLGGTFDPVHAGHRQLAHDAQQELGLAQLRLLPAGRPWQKGAVTAAYHRVAMLALALQEEKRRDATGTQNAGWVLDTREAERDGPSYTVDTLRQMRTELGREVPLVWIMGFDQLERLDTWREWRSIADLAHIAYAQRAGVRSELRGALGDFVGQRRASAAALATQPAGSIVEFPMRAVDCSSSRIRAALAVGDRAGAEPFLAPSVLDYIQTHQLYLAVHG